MEEERERGTLKSLLLNGAKSRAGFNKMKRQPFPQNRTKIFVTEYLHRNT